MEERYNDAQDVPGAVAGGGGDWKDVTENPLKRGRSPDDEGEGGRGVRISISQIPNVDSHHTMAGTSRKNGRAGARRQSHVRRFCIVALDPCLPYRSLAMLLSAYQHLRY